MGTVKLPVPVWRSGENFSPNPCCAPPPFGSEMMFDVPDFSLMVVPVRKTVAPGLGIERSRYLSFA